MGLNCRDANFATMEFDYIRQFNRMVFDISADYQIDASLDNSENGITITTTFMSAPVTVTLPASPMNGYPVTVGYTNTS